MLIPLNVWAYSSKVIVGGENIGINIKSDGVLIVGFYKVNGKDIKSEPNLKIGDYIKEVNDIKINSINELTQAIDKNMQDNAVNLTILRDNKEIKVKLDLIKQNNLFKTGLYVKDSLTGIGTLTYIDPETKIFGALGHEILESNTNTRIEVKEGNIFNSTITGINKSINGVPGEKKASFNTDKVYGNITKNTINGLFGNYTTNLPGKKLVEVASKEEVKIGEATILTVLEDNKIEEYKINITKINEYNEIKNIFFEITDSKLLEKAGGIVQGMSGSPIIQNNKIIGAVTHVLIDNVKTGYGIFITTMLEEGEK